MTAFEMSFLVALVKVLAMQVFWIVPLLFLWPQETDIRSGVARDVRIYKMFPTFWPHKTEPEHATYQARKDNALQFTAFFNNVMTCICLLLYLLADWAHFIAILPIFYLIPVLLTQSVQRIWEDKSPNTLKLAIFNLLFVNVASGILLLCSTIEKPRRGRDTSRF